MFILPVADVLQDIPYPVKFNAQRHPIAGIRISACFRDNDREDAGAIGIKEGKQTKQAVG